MSNTYISDNLQYNALTVSFLIRGITASIIEKERKNVVTTNVSRRGFLGAIGLLPLMGLGGLSGCGKTGIKGKTLYYISVCNNVALGKMTTSC